MNIVLLYFFKTIHKTCEYVSMREREGERQKQKERERKIIALTCFHKLHSEMCHSKLPL